MFINNFDPVAFDFLLSSQMVFNSLYFWNCFRLVIILKKLIVNIKIANLFDDLLAYIIIRNYYRWTVRLCINL